MKTEHNPQNNHKFLRVLANAFLELLLIILLIINSLFCYVIRTCAAYFKLNPPCPFCSKLYLYLLKPENRTHPYKDLICEAHCKEISSLTELSKGLSEECSVSKPNSSQDLIKSICTCCGKKMSEKENVGENHQSVSENEDQIISDVGSFGIREIPDEDSNEEDEINGCSEIRTRDFLDEELGNEDQIGRDNKLPDIAAEENYAAENKENETELDEHDAFSTIRRLRLDLESERKARKDLYAELEAERSASSVALNQTMAMITRLQQDKSTMQMEALQYQRVMEEQSQYDQNALQILKGEFEKELEVYRERFSDYVEKNEALMLVQRCTDSDSGDSDSDALCVDLSQGFEGNEENGRTDISLMECSKEWGGIEDSLEELEGERTMIIQQLTELQEKLVFGHSEEDSFENQPKTIASVARCLLDRLPSLGHETDDSEVENSSEKRVGIEKEMDHVYGRLKALEADTQFLRHCIRSLSKGNKGVSVLKEILQNLSALKAAEICF